MAINQDISNLPTPPSRSDSPSDFSDKADSFLGSLPTLQTELNTYADEANATAAQVNEQFELAAAGAAIVDASAWEPTTTYGKFDAAIGSDGHTYRSLTENNTNNDPVADDGSNWLKLTASAPDILKPDVISPIDGETDVIETPTIKTGGYYSLFGIEQASAQFQIATDSGFSNIIYDSGVLGAVTEHQVPAGNLAENTTHYVRVEFKDISNNTSGFSDTSEFNTESIFADLSDPNNIGIAVGGGFLAGNVVSDVDSQTYAIIVSDGDGDTDRTGAGGRQWRTSNTALTEAQTLADGKSVMDHIVNNETLSDFPVFEWIQTTLNNANYNGYSDWYLPARDELELVYRHFKPTTQDNNDFTRPSGPEFGADGATHGTNNSSDPNGSGYTTSDPSQTSVSSFQDGGADYVTNIRYWSSTEYNVEQVWIQRFFDGRQDIGFKGSLYDVRAVRRIAL